MKTYKRLYERICSFDNLLLAAKRAQAGKRFRPYDKEADVMYLSFDESAKAEAEEIEDGVFARYEPKTKELVGLTITNFSKKFEVKLKEVEIPIHA